jgi:hypothetical protein
LHQNHRPFSHKKPGSNLTIECPGRKNNILSSMFSEVKGDSMKSSHNGNGPDPTLGDLLATISDVAFENSADEKEAFDLARLVLVEILKGTSLKSESEIVAPPLFWN